MDVPTTINEDAGYTYFCLLFAVGYYVLNDIIDNEWFKTDPGMAVECMQGLEGQARDLLALCGVQTYNDAMALLPNLKDESSEFLGHGPKYVALGFACGIVALSHSRDTMDLRMGGEVLEGNTDNATVVMDYFGVDSLEACEALMIRLRAEAFGFTTLRCTVTEQASSLSVPAKF